MKKKNKKRKHYRLLLILGIIIGLFLWFSYNIYIEEIDNISSMIEQEIVDVSNYFIYGTHLNIEGKISNIEDISNIKNTKIVFMTPKKIEKEYMCNYKIKDKNLNIYTSNMINTGIYLEDIDVGKYYILLKINYNNDEAKYYTFSNKTEYKDLEYYTITQNDINRKIDIKFTYSEQEIIPYISLLCKNVKLPDEIYDISIDPGHGGSDPGAISGKYIEAEIALDYSKLLKEALEQIGLKVLLTRDGTEDKSDKSNFNVYSVYDYNGRVNLVGRSKAKYNLSIHLNSLDTDTISGTEIYAPTNADLTIAQSFADNIVKKTGTKYSSRKINKVSNGVYVRTFTEEEIEDSNKEARRKKFLPYNITTSTPYLYMIREVGGRVTGAYVDGRNKTYGKNEYYNSNIGVESYLIELGYIINKTDLNNMLNNKALYVEAIKETVKANICNN